jgi:hypothetical protein
MFVASTGAIGSAASSRADRTLATTGSIDRAATIHFAAKAVSSDANAGLNADAPRAHAGTRSDADTGCAGTDAGSDADTGCTGTYARSDPDTAGTPTLGPLPNTALRRAICITVNSGFRRRRNHR